MPMRTKASTAFFSIRKAGINKGKVKKEDIGLIEVKDFFSFVAVRKSVVGQTLEMIKNERIKNKKVKIDIAR